MELGIDLRRLGRNEECLHATGVEVTTGGLKRIVCESCGHVTIRPAAELSGDRSRSRFVRRSEQSTVLGRGLSIDDTGATREPLNV